MNHLLVDFENTQALSLDRLEGTDTIVHVVIGASQKDRLPFEWVQQFQRHAGMVRLVAVSSSGKNALDFHIAFFLGQLTAADPHDSYHILTNDTGFDPLVNHLLQQGLRVSRSGSFAKLPFLREKSEPALPAAEQLVERTESQLRGLASNSRPRRMRTLKSWIASLFGKKLTEAQVDGIVDDLQRRGVFALSEKGAVSYGA